MSNPGVILIETTLTHGEQFYDNCY